MRTASLRRILLSQGTLQLVFLHGGGTQMHEEDPLAPAKGCITGILTGIIFLEFLVILWEVL